MTLPLTQESIATLVYAFYDSVRADPELGPVFNAAIDDWEPHLARMVEFWSTTMLGTKSFQGNVYGSIWRCRACSRSISSAGSRCSSRRSSACSSLP